MKKLIVALLLVAAALSYGMEIKRHWLEPGVKYMYDMNANYTEKLSYQNLTVPYVTHDFKGAINDMFTLYMCNEVTYKITMGSFDGEAFDENMMNLDLAITPAIEMNLPNDMYIYVEPSFKMNSITNKGFTKDNPADGSQTDLDMFGMFSYDLTTTRIHLLSPWDKYKDQYMVGVGFGANMYSKFSEADEAAEENDRYLKIAGEYNYLDKASAMMIAPSASYKMHMNDKVSEATEIGLNLQFAKDLNEQFNLDINVGVDMTKANSDADMENVMCGKLWGNYFPIVPLRLGAGVEFAKSSADDTEAKISFGITAGYRLDFTK